MARPRKSKATHKLDEAGQRLVFAGIMAGKDNDGLNADLVDAGYPSLSPESLRYYRNRPETVEAMESVTEEYRQAGKGNLGRRLALVSKIMEGLERRMFGTSARDYGLMPIPASANEFIAFAAIMAKYLEIAHKMLNLPIGKGSLAALPGAAQLEADEGKALTPGVAKLTWAQINDMLEAYLAWSEAGGEATLPARIAQNKIAAVPEPPQGSPEQGSET